MADDSKVELLERYKAYLLSFKDEPSQDLRSLLNQKSISVKREMIESRCYHTLTASPPPAVGGLGVRSADPFTLIFNEMYGRQAINSLIDMIDKTIGVLKTPSAATQEKKTAAKVSSDTDIVTGFAFVAMPMNEDDDQLIDVREAIKEASQKCGLNAECVDEVESNERITDRILESIRKAEFVIVDLTNSRPNVYFEAGYAHGLGKIPVYIARHGTKIEFDLKDYPVIFFRNMKELKENVENRLRAISTKQA